MRKKAYFSGSFGVVFWIIALRRMRSLTRSLPVSITTESSFQLTNPSKDAALREDLISDIEIRAHLRVPFLLLSLGEEHKRIHRHHNYD
jgi:hypothetical protein